MWTPRGKERAGRIEAVALAYTHERVAEQTASATPLHSKGREAQREGMYICIRLVHAAVWQKPAQHCKTVILQLKKT